MFLVRSWLHSVSANGGIYRFLWKHFMDVEATKVSTGIFPHEIMGRPSHLKFQTVCMSEGWRRHLPEGWPVYILQTRRNCAIQTFFCRRVYIPGIVKAHTIQPLVCWVLLLSPARGRFNTVAPGMPQFSRSECALTRTRPSYPFLFWAAIKLVILYLIHWGALDASLTVHLVMDSILLSTNQIVIFWR